MSSDVPEPELIKKIQVSLAKIIKNPPLTEKLLRKPPFRFLQDIIKSIVKETGYLRDVFTDEELHENAKDKEKKIAFLKKVISTVQDTTGKAISVKPNKIVAGLEVSKTLELLQLLGSAAIIGKSGDEKDQAGVLKLSENLKTDSPLVKPDKSTKLRSKRGSIDGSPSSANKETKKKTDKSGKTDKSKEDDKNKAKTTKTNDEDAKEIVKNRERPSSRRKSIQRESEVVEPAPPSLERRPSPDPAAAPSSVETNGLADVVTMSNVDGPSVLQQQGRAPPQLNENKSEEQDSTTVRNEGEIKPNEELSESKTTVRRASSKHRPSSSKTRERPAPVKAVQKDKQQPAPVLGTDDVPVGVPKVERPKTARKAPPSARPPSSRQMSVPKMKDRGEVKTDLNQTNETETKPVAVIADSETTQDEENLVVIETQPLSLDIVDSGLNPAETLIENGEVEEGALVAQILETKKEMEENKQIWSSSVGGSGSTLQKVEIDWEGGRKQKKEAWAKEMNRLRDGIQQLTRSANPLGKLFDFLQEDVDSMQRELKTWTDANANYRRQLEDERRLSDESLESYRKKLAELESLIEEEQEAVRTVRANVLANDKRLMSLVSRSD